MTTPLPLPSDLPPALPSGPLLAVHAHPDDETLATGALLATWAASGQPVTLVTCTRGERGEVIGAELAHLEGDGPALARHREGELAAALEALGVTEHRYLDGLVDAPVRYEDSGMAWIGSAGGRAGSAEEVPEHALVAASVEVAAGALAELVRELRPVVVVTYEPGGGYGHPDHVRAHEITVRALTLAAQDSSTRAAHVPAQVWWAVVPAPALRAGRAALVARATSDPVLVDLLAAQPTAVLPMPDGALPAAADPARAVVATIPVRPVLDRVARALAAHATQVHWTHVLPGSAADGGLLGWYALSNDVLVPWLDHEHYARAEPPVSPLSGKGGTVAGMSDPWSAPQAPLQPAAPTPASTWAGAPASPVAPVPATRTPLALTALWYLCALGLGVLVGLVGTVMHRQWMPWILLVALLTVAVGGVLVRAWLGGGGLIAYGIGWLAMVQVLAAEGPGGDVMLPAQAISYAWMIGGMVMIGVAAFAPRRWFQA